MKEAKKTKGQSPEDRKPKAKRTEMTRPIRRNIFSSHADSRNLLNKVFIGATLKLDDRS